MSTLSTCEANDLAAYVEHFQHRVIQDALNTATSSHWIRRAEAFEDARYRPGIDYPGNATIEELRAKWCALTEVAQACRNRAAVSLLQDGIEPAVIDIFAEVAA